MGLTEFIAANKAEYGQEIGMCRSVQAVFDNDDLPDVSIPDHLLSRNNTTILRYRVAAKPQYLAAHVQRIRSSYLHNDLEELAGALQDLDQVLLDKGENLRNRMRRSYGQLLEPGQVTSDTHQVLVNGDESGNSFITLNDSSNSEEERVETVLSSYDWSALDGGDADDRKLLSNHLLDHPDNAMELEQLMRMYRDSRDLAGFEAFESAMATQHPESMNDQFLWKGTRSYLEIIALAPPLEEEHGDE